MTAATPRDEQGLRRVVHEQLGVAQVFVQAFTSDPALGLASARARELLVLDVAAFAWFDDRFDCIPERPARAWMRWSEAGASSSSCESAVLACLSAAFKTSACGTTDQSTRALELWQTTGLEFLELQERRWAAPDDAPWTELDYLLEAEVDSSVRHLLATSSLLAGLDMDARQGCPGFVAFSRQLGVRARLLNDLASVERERHEGYTRNLVLRLEPTLGFAKAYAHVEAMAERTRLCMATLREGLPASDPLVDLAVHMLAVIENIYTTHGRYLHGGPTRDRLTG